MQQFDKDSIEQLIDAIGFCMENLVHPACSVHLAGRFYEEFSESGRALAVLRLLIDADTERFYSDLIGNAQARIHYLTRCSKERYIDAHGACSRSEPFFDALAAQCLELAVQIAAISPVTWVEGLEYEDDFCYAHFFHRYVTGDASRSELETIVARFDLALEEGSSARLDLCNAFLKADQGAFDVAFADLLDERYAEIEREKKDRAEEEMTAAICTHVFVEGLSVLWMAERAGFKTRREYPLCPELARIPRAASIPEDLFGEL